MTRDLHGHVRQDSSDPGWSGLVDGSMGARDDYMARSGGWANDGRHIVHRIIDMLAMNLAIIVGVIAVMAAITWLVDN